MGAWGYGVREDDFVCDVIGAFEDLVKAGRSVREATEAMESKFAAAIRDADDGPLFWIALADVQWTYGQLEPRVLDRVREDLDTGRSLARWAEDPRGLSRRRAALERFLSRIGQPNRRPKKPKTLVRPPKFRPGDCLSIRLPNGQYAAAVVLATDHSHVEHGLDLVGVLDHFSPEKPTIETFHDRTWLDVAWYHYMGFRSVKDRLEMVGHVPLLDSDPKDSHTHRRWTGIGEQAIARHDPDAGP